MRKISAIFAIFLVILGVYIYFNAELRQKAEYGQFKTAQKISQITDKILPQPTIITEAGLPDSHTISTAFVPQAPKKNWDQPWQDACEEASILTVDYYYRQISPTTDQIEADLLDILKIETDLGWGHDINLSQAQIIAQKIGYSSHIINDPDVETIKKYLAKDIPIVVTANGKTLFKENKYFKNGGPWFHSLVILGYNDKKQQFTVHDVGTQYGANFKYSYSLLIESIHDFPSSGIKSEIDDGPKRVLVLLK